MNGLNEVDLKLDKRKKWRKSLYFIAVIYFFVFLGMMTLIHYLPKIYQELEQEHIVKVKKEIDTILEETSIENIEASLTKLNQDEQLDLVVLLPEETVFSTRKTTDFEVLAEAIKPEALSYQSVYEKKTPLGEMLIFLAIYHLPDQQFFEVMMRILFIGIFILSGILIVMIVLVFKNLIRPINRLKENIAKLKTYHLSEVETVETKTEYDVLSEELSEFTDDLKGKINTIDQKYTMLERQLQAGQEKAIYEKQLLTSLVHDLKTPLNISLLNIEKLKENKSSQADMAQYLTGLEENQTKLMLEINDMLKLMYTESAAEQQQKVRTIDLIKTVRDTIRLFLPVFKEKNIRYTIDVVQTIESTITPIELKQLLHNMISNVCQYADKNGEFILTIYEENQALHIEAYNDKIEVDSIDFEHVFDLFYHVDSVDSKFGSGIGMYTIKNTVEHLNGSCHFYPTEKGVLLNLTMPLITKDDDAS
ncbi:sensor histidine kinase [Isobaculum melis]|uniref:histidine kinase n=1 Tax=Isobaculum melis TaxID=142588 RepID=A0A1H9QI64_9LACT|nr:HAMP domain-containing sensor histidine kinase [Isobaculum melis]SER60118.1 Signal transduction histidine kinase [Isobaculum melis]